MRPRTRSVAMPQPEPEDSIESYKQRMWKYAELHRRDPARYPWKVARVREYVGCTFAELNENKSLRDLFWNARRILGIAEDDAGGEDG